MVTLLTAFTAIKDYMQVVHTFVEAQPGASLASYTDVGAMLTYGLLWFKQLCTDVLTFEWLRQINGLPQMVPEVASSLVSEGSIWGTYMHRTFGVLEQPWAGSRLPVLPVQMIERLLVGFGNSLFLLLPSTISHVIIFRRYFMQGIDSGRAAAFGTIAGNLTWVASILFGWRFLIIPWISMDWLRYALGLVLVMQYAWVSLSDRRFGLFDRVPMKRYFALNFLLAWTEQVTVYPFMGQLSLNAGATALEGFQATTWYEFVALHTVYMVGLGIGSWCLLMAAEWFWENPFYSFYKWARDYSKPPVRGFLAYVLSLRFVRISTLYLTLLALMTGMPYHGLDYWLFKPLGFAHPDRVIYPTYAKARDYTRSQQFQDLPVVTWQGDRPSDIDTMTERNRFALWEKHKRRTRFKGHTQRFTVVDAQLYDTASYDLLPAEQLGFGFERRWSHRRLSFKDALQFRFVVLKEPFSVVKKWLNKGRKYDRRDEATDRMENYTFSRGLHGIPNRRLKKHTATHQRFVGLLPNQLPGTSGVRERSAWLRKFARKATVRLSQAELAKEALHPLSLRPMDRMSGWVYQKTWQQQQHNGHMPRLYTDRFVEPRLLPWVTPPNRDLALVVTTQLPHLEGRSLAMRRMSRAERQWMRYRNMLQTSPGPIFPTPAADEGKDSVDITPDERQGTTLLHPMAFYLQRERALMRKWQYYGPKLTRRYVPGQSSTLFRAALNRVFLYPRMTRVRHDTFKSAQYQADLGVSRPMRVTRRKPVRYGKKWVPKSQTKVKKTKAKKTKVKKGIQAGLNSVMSYPYVSPEEKVSRARMQRPTNAYKWDSLASKRYERQLFRHNMENWYYESPIRRFLVSWDVDSFMRRTPRSHWLNPTDETLLHVRRGLLLDYYNSLRWYRWMPHYTSMQDSIGGIKSAANSLYAQQFQGTLKHVRHLFSLTPTDSMTRRRLMFDQPLINEYGNRPHTSLVNQSWLHEELGPNNSATHRKFVGPDATKLPPTNPREGLRTNRQRQRNKLKEYMQRSGSWRAELLAYMLENNLPYESAKFNWRGQKTRGSQPLTTSERWLWQERPWELLSYVSRLGLRNLVHRLRDGELTKASTDSLWRIWKTQGSIDPVLMSKNSRVAVRTFLKDKKSEENKKRTQRKHARFTRRRATDWMVRSERAAYWYNQYVQALQNNPAVALRLWNRTTTLESMAPTAWRKAYGDALRTNTRFSSAELSHQKVSKSTTRAWAQRMLYLPTNFWKELWFELQADWLSLLERAGLAQGQHPYDPAVLHRKGKSRFAASRFKKGRKRKKKRLFRRNRDKKKVMIDEATLGQYMEAYEDKEFDDADKELQTEQKRASVKQLQGFYEDTLDEQAGQVAHNQADNQGVEPTTVEEDPPLRLWTMVGMKSVLEALEQRSKKAAVKVRFTPKHVFANAGYYRGFNTLQREGFSLLSWKLEKLERELNFLIHRTPSDRITDKKGTKEYLDFARKYNDWQRSADEFESMLLHFTPSRVFWHTVEGSIDWLSGHPRYDGDASLSDVDRQLDQMLKKFKKKFKRLDVSSVAHTGVDKDEPYLWAQRRFERVDHVLNEPSLDQQAAQLAKVLQFDPSLQQKWEKKQLKRIIECLHQNTFTRKELHHFMGHLYLSELQALRAELELPMHRKLRRAFDAHEGLVRAHTEATFEDLFEELAVWDVKRKGASGLKLRLTLLHRGPPPTDADAHDLHWPQFLRPDTELYLIKLLNNYRRGVDFLNPRFNTILLKERLDRIDDRMQIILDRLAPLVWPGERDRDRRYRRFRRLARAELNRTNDLYDLFVIYPQLAEGRLHRDELEKLSRTINFRPGAHSSLDNPSFKGDAWWEWTGRVNWINTEYKKKSKVRKWKATGFEKLLNGEYYKSGLAEAWLDRHPSKQKRDFRLGIKRKYSMTSMTKSPKFWDSPPATQFLRTPRSRGPIENHPRALTAEETRNSSPIKGTEGSWRKLLSLHHEVRNAQKREVILYAWFTEILPQLQAQFEVYRAEDLAVLDQRMQAQLAPSLPSTRGMAPELGLGDFDRWPMSLPLSQMPPMPGQAKANGVYSKGTRWKPVQSTPFYAGWDESQRKFVVTRRLRSRQQLFAEFPRYPLKGLNEGGSAWNVAFMTFAALHTQPKGVELASSIFAPLSWRRFQFRHGLVRAWEENRGPGNASVSPLTANPKRVYRGVPERDSLRERVEQAKRQHQSVRLSYWNTKAYNRSHRVGTQRDSSKLRVMFGPESGQLEEFKKSWSVRQGTGPMLSDVLPTHFLSVFGEHVMNRTVEQRYMGRLPPIHVGLAARNKRLENPYDGPFDTLREFTWRRRALPRRKKHRKWQAQPNDTRTKQPGRARTMAEPVRLRMVKRSMPKPLHTGKYWRPGLEPGPTKESKKVRRSGRTQIPTVSPQPRRASYPRSRLVPLPGGWLWPGDYARLQAMPILLEDANAFGSEFAFPTTERRVVFRQSKVDPADLDVKKRDVRPYKMNAVQQKMLHTDPFAWRGPGGYLPTHYLVERHNMKVLKKRLRKTGHPSANVDRVFPSSNSSHRQK